MSTDHNTPAERICAECGNEFSAIYPLSNEHLCEECLTAEGAEQARLREALVNEITFDKLKPVIKSNAGDNPIDEFTLSLVVTKVRKLIRAALRTSSKGGE